ncbi:MAG: electron transfer flavoprotein subunit alpha [Dehalococcoidales bacterium]|nr:electron transfer flavoprotein subunit alpha [Dehalococcoidales bacterium]
MPKNSKGREVAQVNEKKCSGCQVCLSQCPVDAIDIVDGIAKIDAEKCVGCGKCVQVCPADAILFDKPVKKSPKVETAAGKADAISQYKGVAVFIEVRDGAAAEVAWELVGKARELAGKLNTQVIGFLLGINTGDIAREAIAYGCDTVYTMESAMFHVYVSKVYGDALKQLCNTVKPEIFLIGATPLGRDLSSVVATQLQTGLTADCTGLDIAADERLLMMTRPTFGGNIMATILCRTHRPQMSTVRPKVMKMPAKDPSRKGDICAVQYEGFAEVVPRVLKTITLDSSGMVDITRSPVLIVLGKGACDTRCFPMMEELAGLMGGTIACSRPLVEAGLLPYMRQVGQTGKTVAPKLYIGVGVSGAVQHLVGMQGSDKIIAINVDRNAPMVQIADYSIIGDYMKIVPDLIASFKTRLSGPQKQGAKQ